jgi:hypothetical protein
MGVVRQPLVYRGTVKLRGAHTVLRHYLDEGVWWRITDGDGQRLAVIEVSHTGLRIEGLGFLLLLLRLVDSERGGHKVILQYVLDDVINKVLWLDGARQTIFVNCHKEGYVIGTLSLGGIATESRTDSLGNVKQLYPPGVVGNRMTQVVRFERLEYGSLILYGIQNVIIEFRIISSLGLGN